MKKPDELLIEASKTFQEKQAVYGDNYKKYGKTIDGFFPNGVTCSTIDDHNRFGILVQIITKLTRYCENFSKGGHDDSLNDISVYAAMLRSIDFEIRKLKTYPSSSEKVNGNYNSKEIFEHNKNRFESGKESSISKDCTRPYSGFLERN